MAHLVGDDIGIGEIAAATELALHVPEERRVEIDFSVVRAVERAHRRLRGSARRFRRAVEQHEPGWLELDALLRRQDFAPHILVLPENGGHELADLVARGAGLALCMLGRGFCLAAAAHTVHHLGSADEDARVDPQREGDQAKYDDRADAEMARAKTSATAAEHPAAAGIFLAPAILDIVGAACVFPSHLASPRRSYR